MDEKEKQQKTSLSIVLIVIAATLSSFGQLAWKFGAEGTDTRSIILYIVGFLAAGVGMFFMMAAFRYGEVSILQPMMSLSFALSILLGVLFLNEMITWYKLIGTGLIIVGAIILGIEGNGGAL
ncbi:hypothetical protein AUF15_03510 [Enterococcus avium]|uniref:EamA family transporter n=1 Tax=Enterococcus avium TaxID=33945 RepID=UPI0011870691|nr:EamA family transporter [Enterococcus avium]TRZ30071.1 hypothetical protein AUF15_03510 [Enterococcus avium]